MQRIRDVFKQQKVSLPEAMLARIYEEISSGGNTGQEKLAFELWKNSDIRKWCSGNSDSVLKKALKSDAKPTSLSDTLILQIDSLRDISRPAYQQLQKAINRFGENVLVSGDADPQNKKVEEHGKRMLMVNFTDGVMDIQGMEYMPVTQLHTNIPPGTKVQLLPPIICRRGIILLKHENLRVIGGSVPELVSKFAQKYVLASVLKADLASLEKAAPPCAPPNVIQPAPVHHTLNTNHNLPPINTAANHDAFDEDGDALIAAMAEEDWM